MREKVCEFIKKHCALEEEVTEESKLRELSLDSLSFVQVVVDIEAEMGIEFEIEELNIDEQRTFFEKQFVEPERKIIYMETVMRNRETAAKIR